MRRAATCRDGSRRFPRGTIVLQQLRDDAIKVLNPDNKTWYELPATPASARMLGDAGRADRADRRDGDDRRSARRAVPLRRRRCGSRLPKASSLPSDFPTSIDLSGDIWSTDAFAGSGYAAIFRTLQAFSAIPGMEALTAGGRFPLRIAVRSTMMTGYEIRSDVTTIGAAQPDRVDV